MPQVRGRILSKDMDLCALDITGGAVLWKTRMPARVQSMRLYGKYIYLGTDTGELLIMTRSGSLDATIKVSDWPLAIEYAGEDGVLGHSMDSQIHMRTPLGVKKWDQSVALSGEVTWFKGVVAAHTAEGEISAFEAASGKRLWQDAGAPDPWLYIDGDRLFVAGRDGMREYSIGSRSDGVSDRVVFAALARAYLAKGDLAQAETFAAKATDIDPNYPPAVLVRSRLFKARHQADKAGMELARYAALAQENGCSGKPQSSRRLPAIRC